MATRVSHLFPLGELRYEPIAQRVRGELAGQTVVDSKDVWLYWEPGRHVPGWCFSRADVRADVLRSVEPRERERSAAVTEVFDIGDRERVAWVFADPDLEGRVAIDYYRLDRWFEEDEQVVGHPRDPFKRVDTRRSSRHVRVHLDGELVADSSRPLLLFETGLPVRYYLPPEDVRTDLFGQSATRTLCAYKGEASYLSFGGDGEAAWFYPDPLADNAAIRHQISFFNERAAIEVDGVRLETPETPWSRHA
jgi:uncharacterized protein (DUF427 family)